MMVGAKKLKKKKIFVEHSYIAQIFQNNKKKINEINKDEKFISSNRNLGGRLGVV